VAFGLSLLVLLSPDLTLAPLNAVQPGAGPQPIDLADIPLSPKRPAVEPLDDPRTAGPSLSDAAGTKANASRYQSALEAARSHAGAYGVTFAVVRDGALDWAGAAGRARDGRTPLAPDSTLVIGSVTKTFVAATILQLVGEGRIGLDDSVRQHLPRLTTLDREVTIRQLLSHTSGLADLFNDATRIGIEEDPQQGWTADEVLATLHAPWYEPGEGWAYANTNYFLLGLVIERLTGATLAEEIRARFGEPLGLGGTRVLDGRPGDPLEPAWTTIFWGSGAMVSSAPDLARWGDALYAGGLLPRGMREAMLEVNPDDYGLGVQRIELDADTVGYGHTGLLNTYTTLLVHLPEDGATLALLVNRTDVDLLGMLAARPPGGASLLELARGD
jgi:D-alanyl-D-alanine carboxypeptidase